MIARDNASEADMMAMMGFGSFGGSKKPATKPKGQAPKVDSSVLSAAARRDAAAAAPGAGPDPADAAAARPRSDHSSSGDEAAPPRPSGSSDPGGEAAGAPGGVDEQLGLPVSHELSVDHHARLVSCVAVDPPGARFATGSLDCTVRLYDFNGMTTQKRSYRTLEPGAKKEGAYPIMALSWSPNGECLLVVSGSAQPQVYDRDGHELGEMIRGDMYIRDMRNTKGHVSACTWGQWHPTDRGTAITSSEDGTVRAWDMWEMVQTTVIKPAPVRAGTRVHVSTCAYSGDGSMIGAGLKDGSLHLYDVRGKFGYDAAVTAVAVASAKLLGKGRQQWRYATKAKYTVPRAHGEGEAVSSIDFFSDGLSFVSRSCDGTVARWDQRMLKKPVWAVSGMETIHENTCARVSPDGRHVVTGTSAARDGDHGELVFLDAASGEVARKLGMSGSVVGLAWHSAINQIIVGHGGRKEGLASTLFSPALSVKGAKLAMATAPRKVEALDWEPEAKIYLPQAAIKEDMPWKKKKKRPWDMEPEPHEVTRPSEGLGHAKGPGRIGSTHHALFVRGMIAKTGELTRDLLKDPREQLLRHEGKEGDGVDRLFSAYAKTQPERIYNTEDVEREEEEKRQMAEAARQHGSKKPRT